MGQRIFVTGVCLLISLIAVVIAAWTLFSGALHRVGIDALFLVVVCLSLAAAFALLPLLELRRGLFREIMELRGGSEKRPETTAEEIKEPEASEEVQEEMMAMEHAPAHGMRLFTMVWIWLLAITAVEVVLAYIHLFSTHVMLGVLMALSIVKAGLITAYFMHLRFEKMSLILSLVPAVVIVITLLFAFFPDGFRALDLRVR